MGFSLDGVPLVQEFVERAAETDTLQKHLLPARQQKRRAVVVANGLGGIGKTQLSVEFARRLHSRFSTVFWLDVRTEDSVKRSLAAIATRLPQGQSQIPRLHQSNTPASME